MGTERLERLKEQLKILGLRRIREIFEEEADKAIKTKLGYIGYLPKLIEEETLAKTNGSINRRTQTAKFPWQKTIEEFDFSFQPSVDEEKVLKLADLSFIDKKEDILLLGPPGVGKTHLAIGLGIKACMAGYGVLFQSADDVAGYLYASLVDKTTGKNLMLYQDFTFRSLMSLDTFPWTLRSLIFSFSWLANDMRQVPSS